MKEKSTPSCFSVSQLSMVPAAAKNVCMTMAVAQNLLNIDSTEFKLRRNIYNNEGLLDVS